MSFYSLEKSDLKYEKFIEDHYKLNLENLDKRSIYILHHHTENSLNFIGNIILYFISLSTKKILFNKNKEKLFNHTSILYFDSKDKEKIVEMSFPSCKSYNINELINRKDQIAITELKLNLSISERDYFNDFIKKELDKKYKYSTIEALASYEFKQKELVFINKFFNKIRNLFNIKRIFFCTEFAKYLLFDFFKDSEKFQIIKPLYNKTELEKQEFNESTPNDFFKKCEKCFGIYSFNFLKKQKLSELNKKKCYLVCYQNWDKTDRYSNLIRWTDNKNFVPNFWTINHIGFLFNYEFRNKTKKWFILEKHNDLYITKASTIIKKYDGLVFIKEINSFELTNNGSYLLYDLREKTDITNLPSTKKQSLLNITAFPKMKASASFEFHISSKDGFIKKNMKLFSNKIFDFIRKMFIKLNLESDKTKFCSEGWISDIINRLFSDPKNYKNLKYDFSDIKEQDYESTPRDIMNYILYKENENFEKSTYILADET